MKVKRGHRRSILVPWRTFEARCRSHRLSLSEHSNGVEDTNRTFLKPTEVGDPLLGFYRAYKKGASEYDTEYIKFCDKDLNTTLLFVRHLTCAPINHLTCSLRQACPLPLARLSSSTSINNSNQIPMNNRQLSSVPSSSPSIILQSQTKPSPFPPPKSTLPVRSLPSIASSMRAF